MKVTVTPPSNNKARFAAGVSMQRIQYLFTSTAPQRKATERLRSELFPCCELVPTRSQFDAWKVSGCVPLRFEKQTNWQTPHRQLARLATCVFYWVNGHILFTYVWRVLGEFQPHKANAFLTLRKRCIWWVDHRLDCRLHCVLTERINTLACLRMHDQRWLIPISEIFHINVGYRFTSMPRISQCKLLGLTRQCLRSQFTFYIV